MSSAADAALPAGYVINEYRIESTLGIGGFGYTYLATDANLNLKVAIKEYLPGDLAQRDESRSVRPKSDDVLDTFKWGLQRFLDESRTLATFRHPNIVRVMRFFEANNTAYMVMEFVSGQTLVEWMRTQRPLAEAALVSIVTPLLDGLGVIHKGGYLHRDIKPANIFIRDDGSPLLLDFGSARTVATSSELTAVVTPGYAPLEQYHSHGKQGPWSDLYAFGGVLYWMVTGNKPVEAAARVRNDPMPPATQAADRGRYSMDLLTAIDWALAPAEETRPQSVDDFKAVIGGIVSSAGVPPATAPRTATPAMAPITAATPTNSMTLPTALALDRDAVKRMETELASHLGPIAGVVVRKAAKTAISLPALAEILAREIADEAGRAAFLKRHASGERSKPVGDPTRTAVAPTLMNPATELAGARFDAAVLARAETALAQHIGAVARVVVKRAALKARDESELYLLIADEITDRDERKAFVRKAISASGKN